MSDQILIDMSAKIGEIHGTLKAMEKRHEDTMATIGKHDSRIDLLEKTQSKAHGVVLTLGGISGVIGAYFSSMAGIFK